MAAAPGERGAVAGAAGAPGREGGRVLSIQSHVVSGYVGNKSATLPLQLLGFDVDPVMSVQFSNHTGYPTIKGKAFGGDHLLELLEARAHGGYIGTLSLLEAIATVARTLRAANPQLTYVCDPVLGDDGHCYVEKDLIGAYKTTILPLASILTPNSFEAGLLTGLPVRDEAEALAACDALHALGPHTVVITSMDLAGDASSSQPASGGQPASSSQPASDGGDKDGDPAADGPLRPVPGAYISLVASTRQEQLPGRPSAFRIRIPKLDAYFTGTGDLLSALLLAWCARHPADLALAVEKAVAGLQAVLRVTAAAVHETERREGSAGGGGGGGGGAHDLLSSKGRTAAVFRAKELRLVQARHALVDPEVELRAEPLRRGQ
ncbi:pyridoxal kinase [Raphidocelis subcapitata]|uniref:pyridoxal kinase n=1 Tax=Raphidocelis subcapitata TaxID=307507 RepID=A0A2V0P7U1_9CHLO|nr:pyridoxal kinase [Raphidocelis subcapitata]|eukprot:GBF93943.1 pyridoxal kinase [Raphidocelis subcapitata]